MGTSCSKKSLKKSNNRDFVVPSKRDIFLSTYHHHQPWSLPGSIIYYITKNPATPKGYIKVIQSCKYFFIHNPLLIVQHLYSKYVHSKWDISINQKKIDFNNLSSKIWIIDDIFILNCNSLGSLSSITTKIYKFPKKFELLHQNVPFNDLLLCASKCEYVRLTGVTVMNENGSIVTLEKLFESFINVKNFIFELCGTASTVITSTTVQKLLKIPQFLSLNGLVLSRLPENFDIELFYCYIKDNKKTAIFLSFCNQISEEYKAQLQMIVNEIVADERREYKAPAIMFTGSNQISEEKLWKLYARECKYYPK